MLKEENGRENLEVGKVKGSEIKGSFEEKKIMAYLKERPEIEKLRLENLEKMREELGQMRIVKCETIIRDDGMIAKCVTTDKGERLLIRDIHGEVVVTSKNVSGNW